MLVRVVANFDLPNFQKFTPGRSGQWEDIHYTAQPEMECDYLIVINHPSKDLTITCSPDRIWAIIMEPPDEVYRAIHWGDAKYQRVYTPDTDIRGKRYIHSHTRIIMNPILKS